MQRGNAMSKNEVLDYFDEVLSEDQSLKNYEIEYAPLANFINDYEYLKESKGLNQKDLADLAGTTQSAISRFEKMDNNPGYKFLRKISSALGDELLITPMKSRTFTLPYDLHEKVEELAVENKIDVQEFIARLIKEQISQHYSRYSFKLIGSGSLSCNIEDEAVPQEMEEPKYSKKIKTRKLA